MQAIVQNGYGSPGVLARKEVAMRGSPWLVRFSVGFPQPKDYILGWDMAGCVEAMGSAVTQFQPGKAGKVTPVIDRTYPFEEIPAALGYAAEGHARGKVVITVV
jgi:NADPH:quinone reductase-like Zn-dependent oxidoreductase